MKSVSNRVSDAVQRHFERYVSTQNELEVFGQVYIRIRTPVLYRVRDQVREPIMDHLYEAG